jgi:Tfp pilus assembly protein PilF
MLRSLLVFSIVLLLGSLSFAQDQSDFNSRTLRGTVVNSDNSPVADAMVEVRNMQSGSAVARVYTNGVGEFQVPTVTPGQYIISVVDGTRTAQQQISFSGFEPDVKVSMAAPSATATGKGATVSVANLGVSEKAKRALESAQKALSKNKLEEAASALQRALAISPQYPEALSLRAVVYLAKGDTKSALEDAHHSVDIDPSSSIAYTIMGASYNAAGQFLLAVNSLQQALRIDPNFWQSHYEMAKSLYGQGKSTSALQEIETAGRNAPKDFAEMHLVRGAILIQLHRTGEAAGELQQFLKQDPQNPQAANVEHMLATISQPGTNSPQSMAR